MMSLPYLLISWIQRQLDSPMCLFVLRYPAGLTTWRCQVQLCEHWKWCSFFLFHVAVFLWVTFHPLQLKIWISRLLPYRHPKRRCLMSIFCGPNAFTEGVLMSCDVEGTAYNVWRYLSFWEDHPFGNLKITPLEKEIIFQTFILGIQVSFRGCTYQKSSNFRDYEVREDL